MNKLWWQIKVRYWRFRAHHLWMSEWHQLNPQASKAEIANAHSFATAMFPRWFW